ncbi:hypothetical protein DDE82_007002 [Stemphylium lycopersici]|nr:hypothetical protein DDE82_007002 [Stemphylium lycopersici]
MTDHLGAPRRVSLGYILGFSDKPFKDPKPHAPPPPQPRPKKPSQLTSLVSSPRGIIEWTASDGRKGRLTGTDKPRLTAASLANIPSDQRSIKDVLDAKPASNKSANNGKGDENKDGKAAAATVQQQADTGGDAPVAQAPTAAPATNSHAKEENDLSTWTKEEDEKLMQMKTDNTDLPWPAFAVEFGKTAPECIARFKAIKPKGWKSNIAKGDGKGGKKKGAKGDNQHRGQDGDQKEKREEEKQGEQEKVQEDKEEEKNASDPANAWGPAFGNLPLGGNDDNEDEPDKAKDPNASGTGNNEWDVMNTGDATKNNWEATNAGGTDGANDVGDTTKDQNDTAAEGVLASTWEPTAMQDNNNNNNVGGGGGIPASKDDPWPTENKPASTRHSKKAPSQSRSHHSAPTNPKSASNRPLEIEIKPDNVFSADDLRLVARILQQDCSMVWNRVSWRFRDKTGRTLHPDVFEKKITGQLEGKGSEKGEWRM